MVQTIASRIGTAFAGWFQPTSDDVPAMPPGVVRDADRDGPGLSLSAKFAFAASIVLCNGMALLGGWVVNEIEKGLLQTSAAEKSIYVQDYFEPLVAKLISQDIATAASDDAADHGIRPALLGNRLTSVAVWRPDGAVVFSTDKDLLGRKYPLSPDMLAALNGEVRTGLWDKRLLGVYRQRPSDMAIRTIYAPLRDRASGKVVAVAEIADNAEVSKKQLDAIRTRTWMVVGISTLAMIGLLFSIVHQGSRTIDAQRQELETRLLEQRQLALVNKDLSERLQESNRRGIELGEQALRRIGMDLQDGPVQSLALALLRMNELKALVEKSKSQRAGNSAKSNEALDMIELATSEALKEIRTIEAQLILPELRRLSPREALEVVVQTHERTTGTTVDRNLTGVSSHLPLPVLITVFRMAQEGLSNAHRHAGGRGQRLVASDDGAAITIEVSDEGPGMSHEQRLKPTKQLGLQQLRQRVESIGGVFEVQSADGKGTKLRARIPYDV